jgi:hypothetical protein
MGKWITNWPHGGKWGRCNAAMAAQIVAQGMFTVRLVADNQPVSRIILQTPAWAQTTLQQHRSVAVALAALRPLDDYRQQSARARVAPPAPPADHTPRAGKQKRGIPKHLRQYSGCTTRKAA